MALVYIEPNPNPFRPAKTTNARDVFAPPEPPAEPREADWSSAEEPDELAQLRALLTAAEHEAQ